MACRRDSRILKVGRVRKKVLRVVKYRLTRRKWWRAEDSVVYASHDQYRVAEPDRRLQEESQSRDFPVGDSVLVCVIDLRDRVVVCTGVEGGFALRFLRCGDVSQLESPEAIGHQGDGRLDGQVLHNAERNARAVAGENKSVNIVRIETSMCDAKDRSV